MMKSVNGPRRASSPKKSARDETIILLILTIFAPVVAVWLSVNVYRGLVSKSWPTTQGRILNAELDEEDYPPAAIVTYRYEVDGTVHEGYAVHASELDWWGDERTEQQAILQRYPVGAIVTVHYDPTRPQTALLEPGANWQEVPCGLFFLGMSVLLFLYWRKTIKPHPTSLQ